MAVSVERRRLELTMLHGGKGQSNRQNAVCALDVADGLLAGAFRRAEHVVLGDGGVAGAEPGARFVEMTPDFGIDLLRLADPQLELRHSVDRRRLAQDGPESVIQ